MPIVIGVDIPSAEVLQARKVINDRLEKSTNEDIHWYDAPSVADFRQWRKEGSHGFTKRPINPKAYYIDIPSQHGSHVIPLRIIHPESTSKGVFLHFHAGGFVIGSAESHDTYLTKLANILNLTVVSVEYRLAPEHIFPAGGEDGLDATLFALSEAGQAKLGGPLKIIGGESAGAYLSVWITLRLRDRGINVRERIPVLLPSYGIYDHTYTPSAKLAKRRVVLGVHDMHMYTLAGFPPEKFPPEKLVLPEWSPLYADLKDMPPAIFVVGDLDPVLDDTVFMGTRWSLAGNVANVKIMAEAPHAFTLLSLGEMSEEGINSIVEFARKYIG
ncbi:putative carboxylesterase [Xylogone sp. PMI_703]|nr:putative carboxylesterase [Xylogone sp. PMI_703]